MPRAPFDPAPIDREFLIRALAAHAALVSPLIAGDTKNDPGGVEFYARFIRNLATAETNPVANPSAAGPLGESELVTLIDARISLAMTSERDRFITEVSLPLSASGKAPRP